MLNHESNRKTMDDDWIKQWGALLFGLVAIVVLPYVIICALVGYLLRCAWRDARIPGVFTVFGISLVLVWYLVGIPEVLQHLGIGTGWNGALFGDFKDSLTEAHRSVYSFFGWRWSTRGFNELSEFIRQAAYWIFPLSAVCCGAFACKKEWEPTPALYRFFKYFSLSWTSPSIVANKSVGTKALILTGQWALFTFGGPIFLGFLPGSYWTVHLWYFLVFIGSCLSIYTVLATARTSTHEESNSIPIGQDGTALTQEMLNHHVHILGESGFGKSVLLMKLIEHHIKNRIGLIFIDLKADSDTLTELVAMTDRHECHLKLNVIDCSNPDLSATYSVLLHGNPTEIKDKIIGSFNWENEYYKNAAQSFLFTVIRGFVWLRETKKLGFTLEDLYQTTLSNNTLPALVTELNQASAPTALRDDVNNLAHYLRDRENYKELHGLRTQLKLLLDAEFGPLLTSSEHGIDFKECIEKQEIVYVSLDSQRYGESAKRLGKLILQDLKAVSARLLAEYSAQERPRCTIVVDEFADLATEQFVGLLNRARGSGIGIVLAHQEMSDLETFSPTMRDQIMGNTATTISFLQKMPKSAETLAQMAGTKTTTKRTKQIAEQGFLFKSKRYTGIESEREAEEFIVHPNSFKNLPVGHCIVIGKYPRSWTAKITVPPPMKEHVSPSYVRIRLKTLREFVSHPSKFTPIKSRLKAHMELFATDLQTKTAELNIESSQPDPNF